MALAQPPWRILFADDDPEVCKQVKEFLQGEKITAQDDMPQVVTVTDFAEGLKALDVERVDLVILDVRLGSHEGVRENEVGIQTLEAIQQRRFVPVIFFTGLPKLVEHLQTHLVRVVEKTEGLPRLLAVAKEVFETRLPAVNRALVRHLETIQRRYMWDFVAPHWSDLGAATDHSALAFLLARRLATSLSGPGVQQLAQDLGGPLAGSIEAGRVHPMQYYIFPPEHPGPLAGDIYHGRTGEREGYSVLLTPSCDLVQGREKAEYVVLAGCLPLTDQPEHANWVAGQPHPSGVVTDRLTDLLRNNRRDSQPERYFFLPGTLDLPDLIVDFQQLAAVPQDQLAAMNRIASLDSPFAETLLARFVRYYGRLGVPDLALDVVLRRLTPHP